MRPWLVQLAIGAKWKVTDYIVDCEIKLQYHKTRINLNIFPLGSYEMIIDMDWLKKYKIVLNCFDKTFTDIVEDKVFRTSVKGIPKPISMRQISVMQLKRCMRKDCILYAIRVTNLLNSENKTSLMATLFWMSSQMYFWRKYQDFPLNKK